MAEAVAAFYAVETAIEGAAVGAYAIARSTVPLHIKYRRIQLPPNIASSQRESIYYGHSLDVVKGKAYVFGGLGHSKSSMHVLTLPSSLEKGEVDFEPVEAVLEPERPLQGASGGDTSLTDERISAARMQHASTSIGSTVYILGGKKPDTSSDEKPSSDHLYDMNDIYAFSTQTNTWRRLTTSSTSNIPCPRTEASCTSSTLPEPASGIEMTIRDHGTIFIHGGYDAQGNLLRDTWAFDVHSRTWSKWPDLPEPDMAKADIIGEGKISCHNNSLSRVGDGFGKVTFLDFDITNQNKTTDEKTDPSQWTNHTLKPTTSNWKVKSFMTESEDQPISKTDALPLPRKGAGWLPITTGAGRYYNLYFMGQDGPNHFLNDVWSFQISTEQNTAASIKDKVREVIGVKTGRNAWALCQNEVDKDENSKSQAEPEPRAEAEDEKKNNNPETEKRRDGQQQPQNLSGFATDVWTDHGGANVVIWGGRSSDGKVHNDGWIMTCS